MKFNYFLILVGMCHCVNCLLRGLPQSVTKRSRSRLFMVQYDPHDYSVVLEQLEARINLQKSVTTSNKVSKSVEIKPVEEQAVQQVPVIEQSELKKIINSDINTEALTTNEALPTPEIQPAAKSAVVTIKSQPDSVRSYLVTPQSDNGVGQSLFSLPLGAVVAITAIPAVLFALFKAKESEYQAELAAELEKKRVEEACLAAIEAEKAEAERARLAAIEEAKRVEEARLAAIEAEKAEAEKVRLAAVEEAKRVEESRLAGIEADKKS